MKLSKTSRRLSFMSLFLATLIAANIESPRAFAQDDMLDAADDALSDDSLQMEDINIDGKLSASERLRKRREKLEERNKIMVEKKIEDIRVKQEIALTNKLQDAFGKSLNNLNEDKVQVTQAAPVAPQPVVAVQPTIIEKIIEVKAPEEKIVKKNKIIPFIGSEALKGDKIDFESKMNIGASVENLVTPQLSIGLGVGYTTLDITDLANDFINTGSSTYYNTGYNSYYGQGRKMTFNRLSVSANGKFFFNEDSKFKPFAGAAVSYNRTNLKYEDNNNYQALNANFGNEGFGSTSFAGTAKLGAEFEFNDTVGANVDLSYTKTISSGIANNSAVATSTNPDQGRLENITKSIEAADTTAIQAGLVIKF